MAVATPILSPVYDPGPLLTEIASNSDKENLEFCIVSWISIVRISEWEYLSDKIDYKTMQSKLNTAINQFSKRQMTFFRRMEKRGININWISIDASKNIYKMIDQYLK